ncbi:YncE family protein [Planococcus sp. ISL-110]|uniref:YncE family protein n=1 Tax=Planococcus sp. ISL-110 TaxID=2819167 RepID=UPI001BE6A9BD|nr:YncE family protein [Planococcus sp. ISL-110]MBT2569802.1 YncE family protein [Planococcus sp. ISL-110]
MKHKIGAMGALALALLLGACSGEVSYDWPEGDNQLFVSHIKEPVLTVIGEGQAQVELELPFIASDMVMAEGKLVLASKEEDELYALDLETQKLKSLGEVGEGITKLLYDGGKLYAAYADSNQIAQVSLAPFAIENIAETDGHPHSMAFDGTMLYVTNVYGHTVQAIDTATMAVEESFDIVDRPNGVALYEGGLVVGGHGPYGKLNDSVYRYSFAEGKTVQKAETGLMPIEIIAAGESLFVLNHGSHDVVKLDAVTLELEGKVAVGDNPYYGVASGGKLYVSSMDADVVSEIDIESFTVTKKIPTAAGPHAMVLEGENNENPGH